MILFEALNGILGERGGQNFVNKIFNLSMMFYTLIDLQWDKHDLNQSLYE